jgi:hypothetical protein
MQMDGNFVLYDTGNNAPWHTDTWNHRRAYPALQNDGNLVIYEGGSALWSSGTWGH